MSIQTGVITRIEVFMPPGCQGLNHATVSHRLTQLLPFNPDGDAAPDGETVRGDYFWEVKESHPELILRAWNEDDTFKHAATVRVNIMPKQVVAPYLVIKGLVDVLKRVFRIP